MKVVFLTLLLGLVCVAQEEEAEQSVSEVPRSFWSGRRSSECWGVCVCVCVYFVVLFCGSISWDISCQLNHAPFTVSRSVVFDPCIIVFGYQLTLTPVSCSCPGERGSVKHLLVFLHLMSDFKLSHKCLNSFFASDFSDTLFYQSCFVQSS